MSSAASRAPSVRPGLQSCNRRPRRMMSAHFLHNIFTRLTTRRMRVTVRRTAQPRSRVQGGGHRAADAGGVRGPPGSTACSGQESRRQSNRCRRSVNRRSRRTERDRVRLRWRHLDGAGRRRRRTPAGLARANESRPLYSPDGARLAFISDRTGGGDIYMLTLDDRRARAADVRRWPRAAGWLVAGRPLDVLLVDEPRHRRDERPLSRARRRRHADGGQRGPIHRRVLRGAVARRAARGVHARAATAPAQWWRKGHSHLDESEMWLTARRGAPRRDYERLTERGAKQMWPMWSADGHSLYLRVRPQRRAEHLDAAARRRRPAGDALHRRPRAVADDLLRRPHDRLRARLRDVEARHRQRSGRARCRSRKRGAAGGAGARARDAEQRLPGSRAVAGRPQGGVRRARRDLGGVGARRRRRRARDAQRRARIADRLAARQPPHRLRLGARRRRRTLFLYDFTTNARDAADQRRRSATRAPRVSPDGKSVAFVRDGKELRVLDLGVEAGAVAGDGLPVAIAIAASPGRPTAGGWPTSASAQRRSATSLPCPPPAARAARSRAMPNGNANNISWSPDGTYIIFNTNQRTEDGRGGARRSDPADAAGSARIASAISSRTTSRRRRPPTAARATGRARRDASRDADAGARSVEAGRDRLRRHPAAAEHPAGRRRRRRADDQPRRPLAAADGDGRGPAEPLHLLARRAVARAGGRAAADVDRRAPRPTRSSRPTAARCSTSSRGASR